MDKQVMDRIDLILQQINQFIIDNASFIREDWNNHLNEDYPFYMPAHDYQSFLEQVEQVITFDTVHRFNKDLMHHDIIKVNTELNQAILVPYPRIKGDEYLEYLTDCDAEAPQITWEIGIHRLSIVLI